MNERIVISAFLVPLLSLAFLPIGCKKPPPITLSCNASAPAIYPGDPLTATATAGSVNPKKNTNVLYSWSGTGVTGTGNAATVATGSLDPGNYTAKAEVKEGKKGKEGLKPGESGQCEASYTVKAFEPPTIACSSTPTEVKPGGTTTVTAQAASPQNRPLTYSYSATAGTIMGGGTSATFSSAGAPTGAVGITCSVSDDKSHTLTANTTVTVLAPPPPPPLPHTQALCAIGFGNDAKFAFHRRLQRFFICSFPAQQTGDVIISGRRQLNIEDGSFRSDKTISVGNNVPGTQPGSQHFISCVYGRIVKFAGNDSNLRRLVHLLVHDHAFLALPRISSVIVNFLDRDGGGSGCEQHARANHNGRFRFCPCHNFQCSFDEGEG